MASGEVVRARIDADLKEEATVVLSKMGLTVSEAIRLMLVRVAAEKALPFEVRVPNRETMNAIEAAQRGDTERFATFEELMSDLNDESE